MTKTEVEACLASTGAAKYALSSVSGRDQFVIVYKRSVIEGQYVVKTMAGNRVVNQ